MASLYGTWTVANFEKFANKDYSAIDAALTDTVIEDSAINPAEVFCEGYMGTAPSSTSSNPVKYGIAAIADLLLERWMAKEGINPHNPIEVTRFIQENLDVTIYFGLQKAVTKNERSIWVL